MSVTAPLGFRAAATSAGLRGRPGDAPDLAVVVNDGPQRAAAAVFTANKVKAAPVRWSQRVLRDGRVAAVVLNAGGANACTGPAGYADSRATAVRLADALHLDPEDVAVCSTGLIGVRLPMDRLLPGVDAAVTRLHVAGGGEAADAIRTTDTVSKQAVVSGPGFVVGGMAKGAGMLAPGLATMLAVVTTDALVEPEVLDRVLRRASAATFDRVDSDGCMSTNDTVLLLASGASGSPASEEALATAVERVCADLARQLVDDAEGATKSIAVQVTGAASVFDAVGTARSVARSNLLKCAIAGEDPNWGRVLSAVGTSDATFDPDDLAVSLNGVWVARAGAAAADRGTVDLSGREVHITVDLGAGRHEATVWTNDLTAAYVHENSAYPT